MMLPSNSVVSISVVLIVWPYPRVRVAFCACLMSLDCGWVSAFDLTTTYTFKLYFACWMLCVVCVSECGSVFTFLT